MSQQEPENDASIPASQEPPPAELARALAERLRQALGAENVLTGDACRIYKVQGIVPLVVACPADIEDVAATLALSAELSVIVVPWGSGSRMALGYPPRRADLVLSLERLRHVLEYDPADLTISVQAGISHRDLTATLAEARQMLPLDVPLAQRATIGGTLATATPGLRRGLYGGPRDLTIGMRVVDANGMLLKTGGRVVKNVTGYDMSKLFTGSLGTLGVIVEANFKLASLPEAEATLLGIFAKPERALASVEPLTQLAVRPSAVTTVLVSALPELTALAPDHLDHVLLAARFPGTPTAVKRAVAEGTAVLRASGGRDILTLDSAAHDEFWAELNNFPQTATPTRVAALFRVSALPVESASVLDVAQSLAMEHALRLSWLADAATGVLWLRATSSPHESDRSHIESGLIALHDTLVRRWRNVVVLDCPPSLKPRLALWGASPAALDLMREVKLRFDPANRLNPGRFIERL